MTGDATAPTYPLTPAALSPLVLATHNEGKLKEMQSLLAPLSITVLSGRECRLPEPEETADTFAGNAAIKAQAAMRATSHPALADDSGLVVRALSGAPGVHSARWAGPDRDFGKAMTEILRLVDGADRSAAFVAVLALSVPEERCLFFTGRVDGQLADAPRGTGFGYDPIFAPNEGDGRTFGEMTAAEKAGIHKPLSHRARALAAFRAAIAP